MSFVPPVDTDDTLIYESENINFGSTDDPTSFTNLILRNTSSLYVNNISQLNATNINTNNAALNITGTSGVNTNVSGPITFQTSSGNINVANTSTTGKIILNSSSTNAESILIQANGGTGSEIKVQTAGELLLQSSDLTDGVKIATTTAGVPVTIGTATGTVTVPGNLTIQGTTTTVDTEQLNIEDNFTTVNNSTVTNRDSGLGMRRYQIDNNTGVGDVVTGRVQERGTFGATHTATTTTLGTTASATDNFYNGWWLLDVTTSNARKITGYVGSTKVATVSSAFGTNPSSGNVYRLYSDPFVSTYYQKSSDRLINATISEDIVNDTINTANVQQYKALTAGTIRSEPLFFQNQPASASGTTITVTREGTNLDATIGRLIEITASTGLTPALPIGNYPITAVTSNTLSFTAPTSTTSTASAKVSLKLLESSAIYAQYIFSPSGGTPQINGINSVSFTISLPKNENTTIVSLSPATATYGIFDVTIQDTRAATNVDYGSYYQALFVKNRPNVTSNKARQKGNVVTKGSDGQTVEALWEPNASMTVKHVKAGSGAGNYNYFVFIRYCLNV